MDGSNAETTARIERDAIHSSWSFRRWAPDLGRLAIFELAFYLAYSYGTTFTHGSPAPFWLPNSVLLSALLLAPRRAWWIYLLAPLPIRLLLFVPPDRPLWIIAACYCIDSLTTLLAAWRLAPVRDSRDLFGSVPAFSHYLVSAALVAPCIAASVGAGIVSRDGSYWTIWQVWCLGNALAHLTLTPTLYCLVRNCAQLSRANRWRHREALVLIAGAAWACYVAFCPTASASDDAPVLLYLPLPFVIWAATRFGPPTTAATLSTVCVLAVTETQWCVRGPFSEYSGLPRILEIQQFLFVLSSSFLALSVLFQDRESAHRRMRQLGLQLVSVQEAERLRIGRELHDDLAQRTVALSWGLAGLARHVEGKDALVAECARLHGQATEICNEIVRLSHELRPVALERGGLVAALQALCDQSTPAGSTSVQFEHSGMPARIAPPVELALYRVAQEALRNALTHSGSDQVVVQLAEADAMVTLTVIDGGCGFDGRSAGRGAGLGLSGMKDRIQNVGGTLRIDSSPSLGTTVRASVPVELDGAPAANG